MRLAPAQLLGIFEALRMISDWRRASFVAETMLQSITGDDPTHQHWRCIAESLLGIALYEEPGSIGAHGLSEGATGFAPAKRHFENALIIARELNAKYGTSLERHNLSIALNWVGHVNNADGNLAEATRFYAEGLDLIRALSEEHSTPQRRRDLSVSLENLAGAKRAAGELTEAAQLYAEVLNFRRALDKEFGTPTLVGGLLLHSSPLEWPAAA